jgi:hypothetical protein
LRILRLVSGGDVSKVEVFWFATPGEVKVEAAWTSET